MSYEERCAEFAKRLTALENELQIQLAFNHFESKLFDMERPGKAVTEYDLMAIRHDFQKDIYFVELFSKNEGA